MLPRAKNCIRQNDKKGGNSRVISRTFFCDEKPTVHQPLYQSSEKVSNLPPGRVFTTFFKIPGILAFVTFIDIVFNVHVVTLNLPRGWYPHTPQPFPTLLIFRIYISYKYICIYFDLYLNTAHNVYIAFFREVKIELDFHSSIKTVEI